MTPDRVTVWNDRTSADPAWIVDVEWGPEASPTACETVCHCDDEAMAVDFAREYAAGIGVTFMRIGGAR